MNDDILKALGFRKELEYVARGLCPFCGLDVMIDGFRDELSKREYHISGLCQKCQDETFGKEEE